MIAEGFIDQQEPTDVFTKHLKKSRIQVFSTAKSNLVEHFKRFNYWKLHTDLKKKQCLKKPYGKFDGKRLDVICKKISL